jgi:hypothetical protein
MSAFLEIALQHAARGWYVFPCKPRDKYPITQNGWHDASRDEAKIRAWWAKTPNANVGVACGMSGLAVLDIDTGLTSADDYAMLASAFPLPNSYLVRSGRRPGYGVQVYFFGAIPDVRGWEAHGCKGDVKSLGGYVLAAGSVHPSGETYQAYGQPDVLAPTPDAVRSLRSQNYQTGKDAAPVEGGRNNYLTSVAGKMRNAGLGAEALELALLQHNADVCAPPLPDDEVKAIAAHVARYDVPEVAPVAVLGSSDVEADSVDVEMVEELDASLRATPLPQYPVSAFEDTLYLEFAKRAAHGNFVPLEFFIEGAMTYAGAMAANNLHGISEEITPRLYTVLIAFAGIGKGTTFRRIRRLAPPNRMLDVITETNAPRPHSSVALLARAGSEPGLNDALNACPYVCLDFEEMDKMMEKTRIQGSGAALMSIIRTLFDDVVPGITTTSQRTDPASVGYLSLLGAMTPSLWRRAMEGQDSYGSGLGGRFNLVASNEERTASTLLPMEIGDLQDALDAKLADLEMRTPVRITTEQTALDVLAEWWSESKGRPHYNRVNVIAHRKALHLAWIRGLPVITREIMLQAVRLADYLVQVRDAFAVTKGEDKTAIGENRVLHILRQIAPKAVRARQVVELLDGLMSRASVYRALENLVSSGEVEKHKVRGGAHRPYDVYRVCLN